MICRTQQEAIEFQRNIYNQAVKAKSKAAFGEGIYQKIYYQKRISLALKYSNRESLILDLGCGDGTIANSVANSVCSIDAVDVSEEAIQLARSLNSKPNIKYICKPMEEFCAEKLYDLVLMYEAIEHIFAPDYMLKKANNFLKIGGKLILSTPNRSRFDVIFLSLLNFINGGQYRYEIYEDHTEEYSYKGLKQLLHKNNFRIIEIKGLFLSLRMSLKICKLIENPALVHLLAKTGYLAPYLAHYLYFVAEKIKRGEKVVKSEKGSALEM